VVQHEPAWCLRYAPDTNLAFAGSGTGQKHDARRRIGEAAAEEKLHTNIATHRSAANPANRADENRKQRGFRRSLASALAGMSNRGSLHTVNSYIQRIAFTLASVALLLMVIEGLPAGINHDQIVRLIMACVMGWVAVNTGVPRNMGMRLFMYLLAFLALISIVWSIVDIFSR
jgi:hypothetical protein